MDCIAKSKRHGNHRAGQHAQAPVERWILLSILINCVFTKRLLCDTDQAHNSCCQRLTVDADKPFTIRARTPHRHKSLLLFIQQPNRPLVRSDGGECVSQHARNALRALKVVKIQKGCDDGLGQFTGLLLPVGFSYRVEWGVVHTENARSRAQPRGNAMLTFPTQSRVKGHRFRNRNLKRAKNKSAKWRR